MKKILDDTKKMPTHIVLVGNIRGRFRWETLACIPFFEEKSAIEYCAELNNSYCFDARACSHYRILK